jgi:aspartate/methionine/tyrosine aminotransferase
MPIEASQGMKNWFNWRQKNPDSTRREEEAIAELRREGRKIINLSGASIPRYKEDRDEGCVNSVATRHLVEAARNEDWGTYPASSADLGVGENAVYKLKLAVAGFLKRYCGIDAAAAEHVLIGNATTACFAIVQLALLNPGDETVTIEPSHYPWEEYKTVLMVQGSIQTVSSDPDNHWQPNFDELRKKINKRTKAIAINQPTNPTGIIYDDKTIKNIVDIAGEHDLPIISDEMYQLITFDGLKTRSVASQSKDVPVIVTGSMSKFFMKPGWCVGYAYLQDPAGKMRELEKSAFLISNTPGFGGTRVPTPILVAAAKTYSDPEAINESFRMVKSLQAKRDWTCKRINQIPGLSIQPPQASLYGFFRVKEIGQRNSRWKDDYEFVLDMLKKQGVLLRPGQKMGKSGFGHVRTLLYRNTQVLEEAYDKLETFMK